MLGGADNPNGELPSYITGADNGTPIHERSRNIDNRRSLGHWEGDLVSGTKNSHIATLVDRKSRYTIILRLRGKDSGPSKSGFTDKF